jgi:hypothetical protein
MIRHFVVVPVVIAVVALGTTIATRRYANIFRSRGWLAGALVVVALITAAIPLLGQALYDLGLSMRWIYGLEAAALYVFVLAFSALWQLTAGGWWRWLLVVLVPIAFSNWLVKTFALLAWSIRGFAP